MTRPYAASSDAGNSKRPVLLLGWIPRIVVPLARSLQQYGIPVDVAAFESSPRIYSRSIRNFVHVPRPDADRKNFVDTVRALVRLGNHDLIVPADDQSLVALCDTYDDFGQMVQLACPPPEVTRRVLDKSCTLQIARGCGIHVPKTLLISSSKQLFEHISDPPFPWILKPAKKEIREEEMKSLRIADADEMRKRFPSNREFNPPMLLQEHCAGVGVGVEVLMHKSESVAVFQHRRLKEYPYTGGFSVSAISERPDPSLVAQSLLLLRAVGWEGPAMVEFKVDPQTGEAVLMEINGRYWGTISLPIMAGLDFPWYHWQILHGEKTEIPAQYAVNARWRWTAGHLHRFHGLIIAARNNKTARTALLRSSARDMFAQQDALFTVNDPMPAIFDIFQTLAYLAAYDLGALGERVKLWPQLG